jgi:predicted permease
MGTIVVIFVIFAVLVGVASPLIFFQVRKIFREQKNFERGLKMVPLLIHLPPSSSDTEVGNRDVRDVVDENISKAEVLYGIIASTLQKGFKSRLYWQRHL